jgi:hypothetical protein
VGNLALLAVVLAVAVLLLACTYAWVLTGGLLMLYNIMLFYAGWRLTVQRPQWATACYTAALLCMAGTAAIVLLHFTQRLPGPGLGTALLAIWPLALALPAFAAAGLAQRNPISKGWAWGVLGLITLMLLVQMLAAATWPWQLTMHTVLSMAANTAVAAFLVTVIGWAIVCIAQLAFVIGTVVAHVQAGAARDTQRAARTALLCMMVSTCMFAIVTISLWAVVMSVAFSDQAQSHSLTLWFSPIHNASHINTTMKAFTDDLLAANAAFFAPTVLILAALGIALFLAFLPSLVAEVLPRANTGTSQRMGAWLDAGLSMVGIVVVLVAVAYFAVMLWQVSGQTTFAAQISPASKNLLYGTALLLAASATTLLALGTSLSKSLGRLRVVLDTVLDVDNYLREHPRSHNPRARIYARYCALLAHLAQQGYVRIVIVSHSQGTVITADLLRLLHHPVAQSTPYQHLATQLPPLRLITAGSPLKQLYRARFVHLYRWIDHHNTPLWQLLKSHFGLTHWLNVYRSGDYVGRDFWRAPPRYTPDTQPLRISPDRAEYCIGAGGHTHYFDGTSAAWGKVLCGEILYPLA